MKRKNIFHILIISAILIHNLLNNIVYLAMIAIPFPIFAKLPYDDDCVAIRKDCYTDPTLQDSKILIAGIILNIIFWSVYIYLFSKSSKKSAYITITIATILLLLMSPLIGYFLFYWEL